MSWSDRFAPSVNSLAPSGIRRFFDIAAEMTGVISLGVGEPDFITPWHIRESCIHSLEQGYTSYTANHGLLELREEISQQFMDEHQLQYNPKDEVLITVGVSEGLDLALRTIICPGDEILIPEPCYVSYKACVSLAGGIPVTVPTSSAPAINVQISFLFIFLSSIILLNKAAQHLFT